MQYIFSTELYHHGVKGQRWGVRRYRNKDGSLTDRGKQQYKKYSKEYADIKTANTRADKKRAKKTYNKKVRATQKEINRYTHNRDDRLFNNQIAKRMVKYNNMPYEQARAQQLLINVGTALIGRIAKDVTVSAINKWASNSSSDQRIPKSNRIEKNKVKRKKTKAQVINPDGITKTVKGTIEWEE